MMEHQPAQHASPVQFSLDLIDKANVYIGVYAYRYGFVPRGQTISLTELEYNRAVERGLPILVFMMDNSHPLTIGDVELGDGANRLAAFKERVQTRGFVNFFKSPADLRAHVISSLAHLQLPDPCAPQLPPEVARRPSPYIAHPYTLLQAKVFVGRTAERQFLCEWLTGTPDGDLATTRVLGLVALGGGGKSALAWTCFHDVAKRAGNSVAGLIWWSFYESDATFEKFISNALAYTSGLKTEEIRELPARERERTLRAVLDRDRFVIILDGFERLLVAYDRTDAARASDEIFDAASRIRWQPTPIAGNSTASEFFRTTIDPKVGNFLRGLASLQDSRVLITTRLIPADLQTATGLDRPGYTTMPLTGLSPANAIQLWRSLGVAGGEEELPSVLASFENHPLLIQSLAGAVATFRRAPGDFQAWRKAHPGFQPASLPMVQVRSHVLEFALRGMGYPALEVLRMLATFRMPTSYATLAAVLIGRMPVTTEAVLDNALSELEGRGLVGWDRRNNRYDLHPVVRSVVWNTLNEDKRYSLHLTLAHYFSDRPGIKSGEVTAVTDLTPAVELYNTLVGLRRFEDAGRLYKDRLDAPLDRLCANQQRIQLLEMLLTDGPANPPVVKDPILRTLVLDRLALAHESLGRPARALPLYRQASEVDQQSQLDCYPQSLQRISNVLRVIGELRNAEYMASAAYQAEGEYYDRPSDASVPHEIGLIKAVTGQDPSYISPGASAAWNAQWLDLTTAAKIANEAWKRATSGPLSEQDSHCMLVNAARIQGQIALQRLDFAVAEDRILYAMDHARAMNLVEHELYSFVALADLRTAQGRRSDARQLLDSVLDALRQGPYRLLHADALNTLAGIESADGYPERAASAGETAYRLAWCDGPPYAYHYGLQTAKNHLARLGLSEPSRT
jgi:tetratricopeptide (TPR) repeat protein